MKAQILKIAGVKSEKEFYKKYPSHLDGEWINCKLTDKELVSF